MLFSKQPLYETKYAERLYELLDKWRYRPTKFNEFEPLCNSWGERQKFLDQFRCNRGRSFGTLITKWTKPRFYLHVTWLHGPREKCHSLSIYQAKLKDFGKCNAPFLLELSDQLFDQLDFDYGFACSNDEYHSVNINLNVQLDENTVERKQVVGMEWPDCIPGLYWCNYFGDAYFEQGFGSRVQECPNLHRLSNGIRLLRSPSVLDWDSAEQQAETNRLMDILGRDWFFTKSTGMPAKCLKTDKSLFAKRPQS